MYILPIALSLGIDVYEVMKKSLALLLLMGVAQYGVAQTKTVEHYIHLVVAGDRSGFLEKSPTLETAAEGGPLDSSVNDARTKAVLRKGNILDALNHFSQQGWKLVSITSLPHGSGSFNGSGGDVATRCYYLLKKELVVQD